MKNFFLIFIVIFSVSCVPSYRVYPRSYNSVKPDAQKVKAMVVNKELSKEYQILEKSHIYELVEDDSFEVKIKLDPMNVKIACGNSIAGSMLTLGLLPSLLPDVYYFGFEEIGKENKKYNFNLQVAQSIWLFNIFYPKSFKKQAGKALLGSYKEQNKID